METCTENLPVVITSPSNIAAAELRQRRARAPVASLVVSIPRFDLHHAREMLDQLGNHRKDGKGETWDIKPDSIWEILAAAASLHSDLERFKHRVDAIRVDRRRPEWSFMRSEAVLAAASTLTLICEQIISEDASPLEGVASRAISVALQALDLCRDLDFLALDLATPAGQRMWNFADYDYDLLMLREELSMVMMTSVRDTSAPYDENDGLTFLIQKKRRAQSSSSPASTS